MSRVCSPVTKVSWTSMIEEPGDKGTGQNYPQRQSWYAREDNTRYRTWQYVENPETDGRLEPSILAISGILFPTVIGSV
jgi:hypothetical protein